MERTPRERAEAVDLADVGDGFLRSGRVRFHAGLAPLMVQVDQVQPAPYNYNSGDVDAVCESIEVSGMYRPIYVQQSTGHIIAGNHTWTACKELGSDVVPVVYLDVDDSKARRIMVADNQIAALAQPDTGLLLALLDEISDNLPPLVGTGLTEQEVENMRLLQEIPLDTEEDSYGSWPTFTVKLPPHVLRAFMWMTKQAGDDRARFELLLRQAGWDGSDQ